MTLHSRAMAAFLRRETGAVTVEFVVIFPLIILLVTLIVFSSLLLSAASDVQQIAHDLARASFAYVDASPPVADFCASLRSLVLPQLIGTTLTIQPAHLVLLPCPGMPDAAGYITITVTYDFAGSFIQSLGRNLGVELGQITRSAIIHI